MKTSAITFEKLDRSISSLEAILRHRRAHPKDRSDELYYEMLADWLRAVRNAQDQGKPIVAQTVLMPTEILLAMDVVPMTLEVIGPLVSQMSGDYEEVFGASRERGFASEICSAHRIINGHLILGDFPRPDAVVWSSLICDNAVKAGDTLREFYGIPGFFVDGPYRNTEIDIQYLTEELARMVTFLEETTGRRMDWDRLAEVVARSQRMIEVHREILELRKMAPAPMKTRRFQQFNLVQNQFFGSEAGLRWLEQVRDETKANVERGKGYVSEVKHRLMHLFFPPVNMFGLLDWMEDEHGAVGVVEPYACRWGDENLDSQKPLESLARKTLFQPSVSQMWGPLVGPVLRDTVRAAVEHKADGVIFWAHIGCRESCPTARILKEALREVGLPMLVVDVDCLDQTYVSIEQIKDTLEGFFEVLADRQ